jgi:hypothetical protein
VNEKLLTLIEKLGVPIALSVFLLFCGYQVGGAMMRRINEQDKFIRDTLVQTIDRNTVALESFRVAVSAGRVKSRPDGPDGLHSLLVPHAADKPENDQ